MHEVIKIKQYDRTRDIILKNTVTGTIDECFDDLMYFQTLLTL